MKTINKLLSACVIATAPLFTHADELLADKLLDQCNEGTPVAMLVMQARQAGMSTKDLLSIAEGNAFATQVVESAKEYPVVQDVNMQKMIIEEFIDVTFERCYHGTKL